MSINNKYNLERGNTFIIILVVAALLVAAFVIIRLKMAGVLSQRPTQQFSKTDFVAERVPNNPNITEAQKFLFENRLTASSSPDAITKFMSIATAASVYSNEVFLNTSCQPHLPVVRSYMGRKIMFKNLSDSAQEISFDNKKFIEIPTKNDVQLLISNIFGNTTSTAVQIRSYGCKGMTGPAGFIVLFPGK